MQPSISIPVVRVNGAEMTPTADWVVTEEPMEIRLNYMTPSGRKTKSISVTMRTPGNDAELAIGFLYTEGIISSSSDVAAVTNTDTKNGNVILVTLADSISPGLKKLERNFYTSSSCGVCGKTSIESVRITCNILDVKDHIKLPASLLYSLPATLRGRQDVFEQTGGLHAVALFNASGELQLTREDAGRHNAADKLVGAALAAGMLPLNNHILLLSGRASFELMQKAAMAGIKVVAAVGAPSSLAVQMATDWGMTLVGFLRDNRFNIYSGEQRIAPGNG